SWSRCALKKGGGFPSTAGHNRLRTRLGLRLRRNQGLLSPALSSSGRGRRLWQFAGSWLYAQAFRKNLFSEGDGGGEVRGNRVLESQTAAYVPRQSPMILRSAGQGCPRSPGFACASKSARRLGLLRKARRAGLFIARDSNTIYFLFVFR